MGIKTEHKIESAKRRYKKAVKLHKASAFNAVAKIYHPLYKFPYDNYEDESFSEQREYKIRTVMETMYKKIREEKVRLEARLNELCTSSN